MDLHNLATVISPNIFRSSPSKGTDTVRVESLESIRVMDSLLEHQDEFYLVPEDFLPLLRDQEYFGGAMELPSKEFLKKCEAYHRVRANGRTPQGLSSPIQGTGSAGNFGMSSGMSGGFASMGRDNNDHRIASQKSDPSMSRGRQPYDNPGTPGTAPRNGYFTQDRAQGQSSSPSEQPPQTLRSGYSSRQQSPQPQSRLQHQPFSHPSSGGSLPAPQSHGYNGQDSEWMGPQPQGQQWMQPMSLPAPSPQMPQGQGPMFAPSTSPRSYTPRSSGEHTHGNFSQANGHAPP